MLCSGVSYSDWRLMTSFQRKDFLARRTIVMSQVKKRLEGAENLGEMLGLVTAKLLGFF